ncbi:MAG: phage tail protein [Sulfurovum sp.]|nr:phage tail protein [Sulfurovum sp.]
MSDIMAGIYEPILNYQFKVFLVPTARETSNEKLIKGANESLGFNEITIGGNETEIYEYKEGGMNEYIHSFPSHTKAGRLILSHGLSKDSTVAMLRNMIAVPRGSFEAGTFAMVIGMFSYPNTDPTFWYFMHIWPISIKIDNLNTSSSGVVIERLELAVTLAELNVVTEYNLSE